jgi:hypothetical protein
MNKFTKMINFLIKSGVLVVSLILITSTSNNKFLKAGNSNLNKTLDLNSMVMKVKEDIANDLYSAKDTYTGYLTGYSADCPLCGGHLACMPSLDVLHGNVTYQDSIYGELNIVASSTATPCGTVIRINEHRLGSEPIYAIVLDRGVGGNNLDLLTPSQEYALSHVGRSIVSYDILRRGY